LNLDAKSGACLAQRDIAIQNDSFILFFIVRLIYIFSHVG